MCGEAGEIHGYIDPELSRKRRHFQIGAIADVEKAIEGLLQTLAHRIGRFGTESERGDLEPRSIVEVEQVGRQPRDRM